MLWFISGLAIAVLAYGVWAFNRLVADRNLAAQGFADIDVQLKRRADLVPRLVEVVRGYAAYERATLEAVVALRAQAQQAAAADAPTGTHAERLAAEARLGGALSRVLLLQEHYPQRKADAKFRDLAAKLRANHPEVKIIFTSGYNVEDSNTDFFRRSGVVFLQKPYTRPILAKAVRECLDERAGRG